jgi:small subunit ribosomal protein S1
MSWTRKVRKPGDLLKPGDAVEAVILSVSQPERRISLGLKQDLGDPWADAPQRFPMGSILEGTVSGFTNFGAFVQIAEGVEGMIHISEIGAERRLHHPREALKEGQAVRAQVTDIDPVKRQMRLSMKKLAPVSLDEYLSEHNNGDVVTGRVVKIAGDEARVELGEGIEAGCPLSRAQSVAGANRSQSNPDLASLSSMLQARWKGGSQAGSSGAPEAPRPGQIRTFRIKSLDLPSKSITLELAE